MAKDVALVPAEEATALRATPPDPVAQIVALAANADMDVAKLAKLIEMQERVVRTQAEAAFNAAFAAMQGALPTVIERGRGDKGMSYAPLEDVIETVRPVLRAHGFALSHRTEWPEKGVVRIVGLLAHELGHTRTSEFVSAADQTGSKNAVQALGSTISYGRRYTTADLLCIVTRRGADDDGASAGRAAVTDPPGFDLWLQDFEMVAGEQGFDALTAAWKSSTTAFQSHASKHYSARIRAAKETAKRFDQEKAVRS